MLQVGISIRLSLRTSVWMPPFNDNKRYQQPGATRDRPRPGQRHDTTLQKARHISCLHIRFRTLLVARTAPTVQSRRECSGQTPRVAVFAPLCHVLTDRPYVGSILVHSEMSADVGQESMVVSDYNISMVCYFLTNHVSI